jgi:hypothetical protein
MSILRQLKVLVIALLVSNIGLGVFGFYFLRAVDAKYSTLIKQSVPALNELQTLTAVSVEAMRSTNPDLFGAVDRRAQMFERARLAIERDRSLRDRALSREWFFDNTDERANFQNAGETFTRAATAVVAVVNSGDLAAAEREREKRLRPAFERYLATTTHAADKLQAHSLRRSDALTARTSHLSKMLIGLAGWPVMFFCLFLLITGVFIIAVLTKVFLLGQESV